MRFARILFAVILVIACFDIAFSQSGWERLNSGTYHVLFSVDFFDDTSGTVCGDDRTILRTTDSGQNWNPQTSYPFAGYTAISFAGPDYGLAIGGSGAIVSTTDGGDVWNTVQEGMMFTYYRGAFQLDSLWACAIGNGRFLHSMFTITTDGWQTLDTYLFYIQHNGDQEGGLRDVHFFDQSTGCAVGGAATGDGVVIRTTDAGASWQTVYWGGDPLYALDFPTPSIGYAVGFNGMALKTTDAGVTWALLSSGVAVELLDVSFGTPDTGTIVGAFGFVIRTVDGGLNWHTQNLESNAHLRGVDFPSANIGYAVGDSGIIMYTTTGGEIPQACDYTPGDVNGSGVTNGLDVVYLVAFFKGGDEPPLSCLCGAHGDLFVAADANGSCSVNGLDVTYMITYFKGGPAIVPCPDCPPTT
jgi:photosystem II stability/assembly factor-like uncharacterized protein